jgi:hypothetical protein
MDREQRAGHERVAKATKMSSVLHLFSVNVSRVDLAGNVLPRKSFILNPFANRIFPKLDMAGALWGHIVGPLNPHLIIVVESSSRIDIGQVVSGLSHAMTEIAEMNNLL